MENVNTPPAVKVTESPGLSLSTEELPAPVEAIRNLSNPMSTRNSGSLDPEQEVNKKTVLAFYAAINKRDFDAASESERYVQHNPDIADGIEGFKAFLCFLEEKFPQLYAKIQRVFVDGRLRHSAHAWSPRTRSAARRSSTSSGLKTDVIQPIPENAVNQNGMF